MRRAGPWRKASTPSTSATPRGSKEAAAVAKLTTIRDVAKLYLAKNEAKWSNDKHRREWKSSLDRFVHPLIGNVAADAIEVAHVLRVVEPIWQRIPATAHRILGRLEELIDFARVAGLRSNDANPARWRGHLDAVLPAPRRVKAKVHHAAMPYAEVPAFMARLRTEQGTSARALEFVVLTGVRVSEAVGAQWSEIDFKQGVWNVPAERIKTRQPHRVPLSPRALAILNDMRGGHAKWVFPGRFDSAPCSDNMILKRAAPARGRCRHRAWLPRLVPHMGSGAHSIRRRRLPRPRCRTRSRAR